MNKLVAAWIGTTVVLSLIAATDGGHLASVLSLAPQRIWHGELWRLVTWAFAERSVSSALIKAYVIYQFAGALVTTWSSPKLAVYVVTVAVLSAGATCIVALVVPSLADLDRLGGWTVSSLLWIAASRQFPDRELVWLGSALRLKAKHGVIVVAALTLVLAAFVGIVWMIPEMIACAAAIVFPI